MDLLEAASAFVRWLKLGGSAISSCRELIGALLFVHCIEVVPISESLCREVV